MPEICSVCGSVMTMKVVHEGTPYEDFDGFECPSCEQKKREEREQYERDNADIVKLIHEAEDLKRTVKTRRPYEGMTGWDSVNHWYLQTLKRFM